MFPAARVGDTTATGDAITGPGVPTVLIAGMPAAVVGDMVAGPMCNVNGSIIMGSMTVLIGGKPAARMTSQVIGTFQAPGPVPPVPITTVVMVGAPTVMIGG